MAKSEIARDGSKKVKDVCIDFRTREDEALAQKLQDEEFETHYIRNRKERGTARVDVKTAKETYLEEVKKAGLLKDAEYQRLAEDDAWLAAELQQRLDEEENMDSERRAAGEIQDEEYAHYLQQKEKERLEKLRHRRLQNRIERERKELDKIERERLTGRAAMEERRPITEIDETHMGSREERHERDMSHDISALRVSIPGDDSCSSSQGNSVDESEYLSKQQELKDEEYARQLQQQEQAKLQRMMEERDRRLAMKIQRKEADEYRRERAERQMRRAASMPQHNAKVDPVHNDEGDIESLNTEPNEIHRRGSTERRFSEQKHKTSSQREEKRSFSVDHTASIQQTSDIKQRPSGASLSKGGMNEQCQNEAITADPTNNIDTIHNDNSAQIEAQSGHDGSDKHFVNVAACIDPTYKGDDEETPHWTEKRWGLDDGDLQGKPPPVIQNTKRKKSSDRKAKNEKCKQQ